jgi:hypothetical protein
MGLVPRVRAPRPPGAELSLPELALGGGGGVNAPTHQPTKNNCQPIPTTKPDRLAGHSRSEQRVEEVRS